MKNFICLFLAGALALGACSKDDAEPIAVGSVTLSKTTLDLIVGGEYTLTATVTPADAADKTVAWVSSDANVAMVSNAGVVKAVAVGTATITASAGGKSAVCTVKVDPVAVESVTLDKNELTLRRGESETLVATVAPADATDKTVVWSSSDTQVATVSDAGAVTAVEPGTATITASAGGKSAVCTVTVEPDVYVVGYKSHAEYLQRKGYLWKNGTAQELPFQQANSVFVSGDDVYIAGDYQNETMQYPTCVSWKNGTMTPYTTAINTYAHSIFVSGGKEYIAGHAGGNTAYLWTNGVASRIEAIGVVSRAYSVFVSGNDIYVGGNRRINTADRCATYWKNGAATDLTDGSAYASVRSIVVAKGVVYAAGFEDTADGRKAVLWTDGVATYLPEGTYLYGVAVSDKGDVFVAGQGKDQSYGFWKNGRYTELCTNGMLYSIAVYGEDVYVAGYNAGAATLWKNSVATTLPEGTYALSVFVH